MTARPNQITDVFVVGGGTAGSTLAALRLRSDWRALLFKKARHLPFHFGKSELPMNLPILARIGLIDAQLSGRVWRSAVTMPTASAQAP